MHSFSTYKQAHKNATHSLRLGTGGGAGRACASHDRRRRSASGSVLRQSKPSEGLRTAERHDQTFFCRELREQRGGRNRETGEELSTVVRLRDGKGARQGAALERRGQLPGGRDGHGDTVKTQGDRRGSRMTPTPPLGAAGGSDVSETLGKERTRRGKRSARVSDTSSCEEPGKHPSGLSGWGKWKTLVWQQSRMKNKEK